MARDEEVDPQLERATEFANRALDKAGVPEAPEPRETREEREPAERVPDTSSVIDRLTHPAHERVIGSRRDREIRERMEAMEAKLLERVDKLVPKPAPPQEPDFNTDPVGWQEWRDKQFHDRLVEDITQRIAPPKDPVEVEAQEVQRRTMEDVGSSMREYVESTFETQGYADPGAAWDAMSQRSNVYQQIRVREIMQERMVDYATATAWKNQEVAMAYRWASQSGKHPIAYLDGLAMRKIQQYAGAETPQRGATVDDDVSERKRATSSSMAGGIGTTAAPRSGADVPVRRMTLGSVPKDRAAYRELVAKNRQPGETLKDANRRIQLQVRSK